MFYSVNSTFFPRQHCFRDFYASIQTDLEQCCPIQLSVMMGKSVGSHGPHGVTENLECAQYNKGTQFFISLNLGYFKSK